MTSGSRSWRSSALELALVVAVALALALGVQAFLVKPYRIPSGSMFPTLRINQRILVNRIGNDFSAPRLGDIVVFHPPRYYAQGCANPDQGEAQDGHDALQPCGVAQERPSSETFVKRVVGLPGDRIQIIDGHVYRNGIRERDRYAALCGPDGACNFPRPIAVPRGDYYMMGDNRGESDDSRFWGPVPRAWIIGKAFFTYWPPGRIGFL